MNEHALPLIESLLDRQKEAWHAGKRLRAEEFLEDSEFADNPEAMLDLIYNEVVTREELGETPNLEEYVARYPGLRDDLKLHFEIHGAMNKTLLGDTPHPHALLTGAAFASAEEEDDVPVVAGYDILGELGRGGMGIVYKARQRALKRLVALKMFKPGRLPSPRELTRFRTEAEAVARLQHPHIVQIFEVGQCDGLPFLTLELAEQGTLQDKLLDAAMKPKAAAELIETLSRAMHYAHQQQIIHRDLKPANVLFTADGTPKITDFGLAKVLAVDPDDVRDPTQSGQPVGTPRYMAPEQIAGKSGAIGPATDVYALGTLLYECLTGRPPFMAEGVMETMDKIRREEPLAPRRLQGSIPRDLETICLRSLHKDPGRRYTGALALADDLRRFGRGEPIHARRTPVWERTLMWCRRRPAQAALLAAGLVLLVTGLLAAGVRARLEHERLANLRAEVALLIDDGKDALAIQDLRTAQARFGIAWSKVLAEPALHDHVAGVYGWLDHSRRDEERQRWKRRAPPPLFDELRDEAFLQSVFMGPKHAELLPTAREAIQAALALTLPDDPAWQLEREQLLLLDADLVLRQGAPQKALAILDQTGRLASRLWHQRRAACFERLGQPAEAQREVRDANKYPPQETFEAFLNGVERFQSGDPAGAVRAFDKVLATDADHFRARFFQAACFLELQRPGEARVALTACIAQRPYFTWSYIFRGRACLEAGAVVEAAADLLKACDMKPHRAPRSRTQEQALEQALALLCTRVAALPAAEQDAFWAAKVRTDSGLRPLREVGTLQRFGTSASVKDTIPCK